MTPAALQALVNGDIGNFIAASTPGGIEAQEKAGQIEQSFAETLPLDLRGQRAEFEKLGFVFGKPDAEELFIEAKFPTGWRKKPTEHSMWTEIVDEKGRRRGSIFYKAAFYDRSAHADLAPRFYVASSYEGDTQTLYVSDACGKVEKKIAGLAWPNWGGDRATAERLNQKYEAARKELESWLDGAYPQWHSPLAHWED